MSSWNAWARSRDDEARWPAGPWGSATLRAARLQADREEAQLRTFGTAAPAAANAAGENAPQPPISRSRGAFGGAATRRHDSQLEAAVEVAASVSPAAQLEMHHALVPLPSWAVLR